MKKKQCNVVVVMICAALVVSACSGGNGGNTVTGPSPTPTPTPVPVPTPISPVLPTVGKLTVDLKVPANISQAGIPVNIDNGQKADGRMSDATGRAVFTDLPFGWYRIFAQGSGLGQVTKDVNLTETQADQQVVLELGGQMYIVIPDVSPASGTDQAYTKGGAEPITGVTIEYIGAAAGQSIVACLADDIGIIRVSCNQGVISVGGNGRWILRPTIGEAFARGVTKTTRVVAFITAGPLDQTGSGVYLSEPPTLGRAERPWLFLWH